MRSKSDSPTVILKFVDVYLGFEIHQASETLFVATPQGWAGAMERRLEAEDLPTLRKRIWAWWHNLLD